MTALRLDASVDATNEALREAGVPSPELLLLLGTGVGTLPGSLASCGRTALEDLPGVPAIWSDTTLVHGGLGDAAVWLLEDAPGGLEFGEGGPPSPPWERGWPVWLAAAAGAPVAVFTAAGGSLSDELPAGTLAVLRDHLNVSGQTPLLGLGETRLGPLFPDQSLVHHEGLRQTALELAAERGIALAEAVAACVAGPALTTPAERRWYATTGADLFVQGLAGPLLACAHAGLTALTLIAITEADDQPLRMSDLVARSEACAPALEDLVLALRRDLARAATELAEEAG